MWNCTHFRHPTDEQLRHVDICFLATKIICSLSTLNCNCPYFDIISINETKLDDTIKSCEVHIPGYKFIRRDRNRQGGGVGFYIKTSINFEICSNLNVPNLENLCIEIRDRKPNSNPLLIAT